MATESGAPEEEGARTRLAGRALGWMAVALGVTSSAAFAQIQANPFFDDATVQVINLTMAPADWSTLQQNYLLDTYYHATFTWNGITENVGIRSHGGGSRSPIKPNLDINFAHYAKTQTFLGLPFILLKANNEDASNLREWISMKLYRKMGIPAPREAPAQVFLNGQILGFYYIVEHLDETFLQRDFGESGGYLYEYENSGDYEFGDLGTDPSLYATFLNLKTNQAASDLQTFANLVQVVNQPPSANFTDDAFIAALSQYLDPKQFLAYGATEQVLTGSDSLIGGLEGMNNFYLYQFQGTTLYYLIPWDKDMTFSGFDRDLMDGIFAGPNINLLARRLATIPQYMQVYLGFAVKAATLMGGTGGWADSEIAREYGVIQAAATNDPNKQCMTEGVLNPCGNADFEADVQWLHSFLSLRAGFVLSEAASYGYQPSTTDPQAAGVCTVGGLAGMSPGDLATVNATNLGPATMASGTPLPRVLGNMYVTVEGVRAPLFATWSGGIGFQVPVDLAIGNASVVVSSSGAMSNTIDLAVEAATPVVFSVVHDDWSQVSAANPIVPGETISLFATGLGAVNDDPATGAAGPMNSSDTTLASPQVLLGNAPLSVAYSGLAPGFVALYQINARAPSTPVQDGAGVLTLIIGGQTATWQPAVP